MDKKQKHPWWLIWLFNAYVKCRIWVSFYRQTFCYYFGIYSPSWLLPFFTIMFQMNKWQLNGTHLKIYHIEYAICKRHLVSEETSDSSSDSSFECSDDDSKDDNDNKDADSKDADSKDAEHKDADSKDDDSQECQVPESQELTYSDESSINTLEVHHHYCYDITDRSLWYFYTLGNDYDGYFEYIQNTFPNRTEMGNVDDNHIIVKYGTKKQPNAPIQKQSGTLIQKPAKNVYVALFNKKGLYELQVNNRPFIQGSITFNTLFFLSEDTY